MDSILDKHGFMCGGILNVTPSEALELCSKGAVLVDVREEYLNNFKNFDVTQLILFPISKLVLDFSDLPIGKYLIFADTVGLRSKEAVSFLMENGFENIANMAGGMVDWERDGLPLKTNVEERLSGSCMCQLKPREGKKISKNKR
jgi:rhodanese-related sulfurtransferase